MGFDSIVNCLLKTDSIQGILSLYSHKSIDSTSYDSCYVVKPSVDSDSVGYVLGFRGVGYYTENNIVDIIAFSYGETLCRDSSDLLLGASGIAPILWTAYFCIPDLGCEECLIVDTSTFPFFDCLCTKWNSLGVCDRYYFFIIWY